MVKCYLSNIFTQKTLDERTKELENEREKYKTADYEASRLKENEVTLLEKRVNICILCIYLSMQSVSTVYNKLLLYLAH